MNLTIGVLGCEVLHVSTEASDDTSPGDVTTNSAVVGFVADDLPSKYRKGH